MVGVMACRLGRELKTLRVSYPPPQKEMSKQKMSYRIDMECLKSTIGARASVEGLADHITSRRAHDVSQRSRGDQRSHPTTIARSWPRAMDDNTDGSAPFWTLEHCPQ